MTFPASLTLKEVCKGDLLYYSFPSFDDIPFVRHGFSTRLGGVSEGIYTSMNLGFSRGDDENAVRENFSRIARAIGFSSENVVLSAQTHTTNIANVTAEDRGKGIVFPREFTDVDGLITDQPGVVLCTLYADCVPLFFVDPVRRVVATSHAGWRGTADGMALCTVERMASDYGCDPKNIMAGIAPSIGPCCFEVDRPVLEAFEKVPVFDKACYKEAPGDKFHINLWEVNRRFLMKAGISPEHITVTDLCTRCHPDVFWSHRATAGQRGSAAAFITMVE